MAISDFYVICYDVTNSRRRRRVADTLENYGQRVQGSVFECYLSQAEIETLTGEILSLIDEAEDRLRCYRFCPKDLQKMGVYGIGQVSQDNDYHLV